jgi:hypothetical protein
MCRLLACIGPFAFLLAMNHLNAAEPTFPEPARLPPHAELPDPLLMFNGEKVKSKEDWVARRRPELKALFGYYMYGFAPPPPEKLTAKVLHTDPKALDGAATLREIALSFGPPETPKIHVLLVLPNDRKGPAPVFVGLNFCGNHALVKDPAIRLPDLWMYDGPGVKDHRATEAGRGSHFNTWAVDDIIRRGYGLATAYDGDIDPDLPTKREGIQPHLQPSGTKPGPHDWGTIAAWAWGLQRIVDHLLTDSQIDRERIIAVGHSRLGKTALLAAALDDRIALAIPHQAGCGGTAPSRGKVGESVQRINTSFPHWFNATFKEFNEHPERLPFDQNCLVALVAPRPVLFTNAVMDTWANPVGQFDVLRAADPVYRFLGVEGLEADRMPEPSKLITSRLGYYIRPGEHSMTRGDWKVFLDFADRHLSKSADR